MKFDDGIFGLYSRLYENRRDVELSLEEYLGKCSDDPSYYAGAAERMLSAIGEPVMVDTSQDSRLGRIFMNRTIKVYPEFADFFGMEETIERIVGFIRDAAQGLEERKQILYLLGPVGGGKSSLAERLKQLMKKEPVYVLKAGKEISPVFESPLGLFDPVTLGDELEKRYGVPNQDVSSLVGKVDIRKLEFFSQNDPDAYSYSGGLNRTTRGLLEFVEMFKAPIKMLHPLLRIEAGDEIGLTDELVTVDPDEPQEYSGVQVARRNTRSRDGPLHRTSWSRDGPNRLN
jgi:serine protein kinase